MRRSYVAVVALALLVGACGVAVAPSTAPPTASPSPTSSAATIGQAADDGARIIDVKTLGPRTRDLTIESPAVGTVKARLLLPTGFADQQSTRYPVLYLLHGGGGEYVDWSQETKVEAYTAPLNLLVVMPAAASSGMDGWYTDWQGAGLHGRPLWETFHLTELRQLLERNWQASDERAVAGLSLGGYGAVLYSERHPGFFKAAASYSGVLDITAYQDHFPDPNAVARWGDTALDPATLASVNPINLVSALHGMPLYISHGNGEPGPLDPPRKEYDALEAWVGEGDDHFVAALKLAGIPATVDAYGPGTHSWAYWDRELGASLPLLEQALGLPPAPLDSPISSGGGSPTP